MEKGTSTRDWTVGIDPGDRRSVGESRVSPEDFLQPRPYTRVRRRYVIQRAKRLLQHRVRYDNRGRVTEPPLPDDAWRTESTPGRPPERRPLTDPARGRQQAPVASKSFRAEG